MDKPVIIITIIAIIILGILGIASAKEISQDNFGAISLYNQAVDEAQAGRYEQAVVFTDKALEIQPNFTLALVTKTGILLELGRISEAEISLNKAVSLEPDNPSVLASAASMSIQTGKMQEAIHYSEQALAKDPSLVQAWIIKGTAHGERGEFQQEIDASHKALEIEPDNQLALSNLEYAQKNIIQTEKSSFNGGLAVFVLLSLSICFSYIRKVYRRED
jgi:tetratricopeptide (TPR) repeat protein